ncbi:hypothetical protein HF086_007696, partial [Spodoptera exigua]
MYSSIGSSVENVLNSAGFPLHKIRTNCPEAFQNDTTTSVLELNKESSVLGLNWSPDTDTLHFSTDLSSDNNKITKRSIISLTCKIFDPLGLLCACVIKAKIILQLLWNEKLAWDDPVPSHIAKKWLDIAENLKTLSDIKIPRYALCDDFFTNVELHCFVDASHEAYGACVYLRSTDSSNNIVIRLLCAKSRVAPLKAMTTPRLELCSALLGARLVAKVLQSIRISITNTIMWTDSTVVLGWLKAQPKLLKTFVANRVAEVLELTKGCSWRHVPTDFNPADLASRGCVPQRLLVEPLWWEGPSFLKEGSSSWPQTPHSIVELPELKAYMNAAEAPENHFINFKDFSNFNRLKRIFAYRRVLTRMSSEAPKPVFRSFGGEPDEEPEVTEIESLCMNCHENGMTRLLLTRIPFYKNVVVMSFSCEHCGYQNNELQPGGSVAERGVRWALRVEGADDLNRQVVKSDYTSVRIPSLDFEIPAQSQKGDIPHFKEVVIMSTTCDYCGHRTNEV